MEIRSLVLCLLLMVSHCPVPVHLVEQGFVYCPAYPCLCESDNGALVVNCQYLYLTHLPKFLAFDGRIRTLSLRQNSIRQLPARAFMGLHVENLDLTENVISRVNDLAFEGLEDSLEELHLQVYAMKGLPSAAIKRLKKLRVLRIIGCKANTLTSTAFEGLSSLVELHLEGCRVKDILPGSLAPLKQLQVLNLEGNSLQFQHLAEVGKLYELRKLVLAKNRITHLGDNAFDHLLHLRLLDLSHNKMTEIDNDAFRPLHYSLEVLKLNDNLLPDKALVPMQNLRNLRLLALGGNNISSLASGHFYKHGFLSHLDLSDNRISRVGKKTFKGTKKYLQVLKLDNNPLRLIENGTFSEHSRLEQLYLDSTDLGGAISVHSFDGVEHTLQKLSLGNSNITSKDLRAISELLGVEHVGLSGNLITDIPDGVFQNLQNLKKLDLSENAISTVPATAFRGLKVSLESLDLHGNDIETLSRCVFEGFQRLGDLRLRDNPLLCDCRLAWLHNWLRMTLPDYHRSLLEWKCAAPDSLSRRYFGSLTMADLNCPGNVSGSSIPACNSTNVTPAVSKSVPGVGKAVPSPMMPLNLQGTALDVKLETRGRSALQLEWNTTSDKQLAGFRVVLRRGNDSFEEADMTFSTEVTQYLFTDLLADFQYEACVTVVADEDVPVGRDCTEARTGNSTTETKVVLETTILPISFTTLLWSYISGCLVASTLCAILAVVVRRRRQNRKCPHMFRPGYTAWNGTRYSIPSSAGTSSCYFTSPSVASYDDDGLVVTIGGVSADHSVVDRISTTGPSPAGGSGASPSGGAGGGGEGFESCGGAGTGAVGGGDFFHTHGRCSTVSSFRRHLPANYIVTNTDLGDDFFFSHF